MRIRKLWRKAFSISKVIGRLNKIAKEIQLYGATRNHYSESVAKDEDAV